MMLSEGSAAPNFPIVEEREPSASDLHSLKGRYVVLYFYPKDDTEGCTAEAKDFSCLAGEFADAGAAVIGISPDGYESHEKFRAKHDLNLRLASDEDKSVANSYGVWVEKKMYGRTFWGVERATFLIDRTGAIAKIWRNVRVAGHADDVLASVKSLASAER